MELTDLVERLKEIGRDDRFLWGEGNQRAVREAAHLLEDLSSTQPVLAEEDRKRLRAIADVLEKVGGIMEVDNANILRSLADRYGKHLSEDSGQNKPAITDADQGQEEPWGYRYQFACGLLSEPSLARVSGALQDLGVDEVAADSKAATVVCAALDGLPGPQPQEDGEACERCGGSGTITVAEPECCRRYTADGCCGNPDPVPVPERCPDCQPHQDQEEPDPAAICRCGHARKWHGQEIGDPPGSGECEHDASCECRVFDPQHEGSGTVEGALRELVDAAAATFEHGQRNEVLDAALSKARDALPAGGRE